MIPEAVISIRREICARCDVPCAAHQTGQLDHADPAATCPRVWSGRWGRYGSASQARPATAPAPSPESPGVVTKLTRARQELGHWLKAGAPLAPRATRRDRLSHCRACPYYAPRGNWGLGECQAPGCGCTRVKLALATSSCPLTPPKWGVWKSAASGLQP